MNYFLLGRLSAMAQALAVEAKFLTSEDEDEHVRLQQLSDLISKAVADLVDGEKPADG